MIDCKYLFYIKAGSSSGLGHLRRCTAIASRLKKRWKDICFLVDGDSASLDLLREKGFNAFIYSRSALKLLKPQMTVIDQKGDTSQQIKVLRSRGSKICLIDNTTKARLISDVVIFPVSHFNTHLSWKCFKGKKYIGAKYFPLNDEFLRAKPIKHKTFTILITMGGADPNRLSSKIAIALNSIKKKFKIMTVLGAVSKHQNIPRDNRFTVIRNSRNIARLMARSDIAITAFGTTLYELAYMGIPAIIVSNYRHETEDIKKFAQLGTSISSGFHKDISWGSFADTFERLIDDKERLMRFSSRGRKLVDGKGAQRIASILKGLK